LLFDLDLEILDVVDVVHQLLEGILFALEKLLNLLLVDLHPFDQLPLPLGLLLKLLLPQQLLVDRLLVSEVLLVDCTPNLGSCLCWGNRYFPFIDVLHSR
jgi:hypothetical protein